MPASVVVAVAGEGILIPINLLSILGNLVSFNCGAVVFCALRIAFEVACLVGFFKRQSQARWASIVLSGLGIVFFAVTLLFIFNNAAFAERATEGLKTFVVIMLLFQIGILGTLIVSLLMPSASRYFDL